MRQTGPTHYEVLGVMADATTGAIRNAYREKAKLAHPDAGGDPESFRLLLEAYQTLSNAVRRRDYDDAQGIRQPMPSGEGSQTRGGWTGTKGDFTGSVSFPEYLRDVTEQPWRPPAEQPTVVTDEGVDPGAPAGPADVVWWWPDQAVAPPVTAGPLLIVPGLRSLVALASLTGHEAWRADLGSRPVGSPVVIDDTVVVWTENGTLHGLELGRGVTRWELAIGPPGPGGMLGTGRQVILARADERLVGVDATTGAATWAVKLTAPATVPIVTADGLVIAITGTTVEAAEVRKGRYRWRIALKTRVELPPCAVGSTVWVAGGGGAGTLVRLTASTGAVAGMFRAGSAIAGLSTDGSLLFASVAGPPRVLAIDDQGRLHLSVELPNVCPEPASDEEFVYLADPTGRILKIDRLRRRVVASGTVPFDPVGAPIRVGDRLVLTATDGRVWATAI